MPADPFNLCLYRNAGDQGVGKDDGRMKPLNIKTLVDQIIASQQELTPSDKVVVGLCITAVSIKEPLPYDVAKALIFIADKTGVIERDYNRIAPYLVDEKG